GELAHPGPGPHAQRLDLPPDEMIDAFEPAYNCLRLAGRAGSEVDRAGRLGVALDPGPLGAVVAVIAFEHFQLLSARLLARGQNAFLGPLVHADHLAPHGRLTPDTAELVEVFGFHYVPLGTHLAGHHRQPLVGKTRVQRNKNTAGLEYAQDAGDDPDRIVSQERHHRTFRKAAGEQKVREPVGLRIKLGVSDAGAGAIDGDIRT